MTSPMVFPPLADLPVGLDVAARRYLGVPFLHQGRDPSVGVDCVGLLHLAVRDCGHHALLSHDITSYDRNPANGELESRLRVALVPVDELSAGCVATFNFFGQTRHVGIIGSVAGRLTLIHAYGRPNKVIEHGLDDKWRRRISGIYRVGGAA